MDSPPRLRKKTPGDVPGGPRPQLRDGRVHLAGLGKKNRHPSEGSEVIGVSPNHP